MRFRLLLYILNLLFTIETLLGQDADRILPAAFMNEYEMEFVKIPAGSFTLGSSDNPYSTEIEKPAIQIEITKDFYLGKYEVTQKQWQTLMQNNPSRFIKCGLNCPIEKVSWNDANAFIQRLNSTSKHWVYDLPTEAEWEYAAKVGNQTGAYTGDYKIIGRNNSIDLNAISWYGGNSAVAYDIGYDCSDWEEKQIKSKNCGPHPVGLKKSNGFGLYDMLGNVWEWCKDDYDSDAYSSYLNSGKNKDVFFIGEKGGRKVLRGGSWADAAVFIRATERYNYYPDYRNYNFGFRVLARPKN